MESKKSDLIWSGKDCFSRDVCLYVQERDHIIARHPDMNDNFTAIYDTVTSPDSVFESPSHCNREVMYKRAVSATYHPLITKVIVEYNVPETGTGHIVTAFPNKQVGGNVGKQKYPQE